MSSYTPSKDVTSSYKSSVRCYTSVAHRHKDATSSFTSPNTLQVDAHSPYTLQLVTHSQEKLHTVKKDITSSFTLSEDVTGSYKL